MVEQEYKEFMQAQINNPYYEINLHELVTDPRRKMRVAGQYLDVPQPMRIHRTVWNYENALDVHLQSVEGNDAVVLHNLAQYFQYMQNHNLLNKHEYLNLTERNMWLRTPDKTLPLYTDSEEVVHYAVPSIKINGMFIRIYKAHTGYKKHFLYTSSGIWNVSINQWAFSGGPKTQYSSISRGPRRHGEAYYEYKLNRYVGRKRATTKEVQLIHSLLNPMSEVFLDINKALKNTYGYVLRKEDMPKLATTQAFRGALMKEITALFPSLKKAIKEKIDESKVADYLSDMMSQALEKETSAEQKALVQYIVELAYSETTHVTEGGIPIGLNIPAGELTNGEEPEMEDAIPSIEEDGRIMEDMADESEMEDEERMRLRNEHAVPNASILDDFGDVMPVDDDFED